MRAMRDPAIALVSLLICGCSSSPPIQFFILDAVPPATDESQELTDRVQIVGVRVPATLDRQQMVREELPNKLTISDQNRWGAPLADMTARVLSQDLMLRLAADRVILPEQPAPAGTSAISVDIIQFGVDATGRAVLDGSWSIVPSGEDVAVASYHFRLGERPMRSDYGEQAHTMSLLLGQLADSMAHELRARDGH
jgi:uncharacterized protein